MSKIIIPGNQVINGEILISGAKNGALPLLPLSLLTNEEITISNIPDLTDISIMTQLIENHGVLALREKDKISLNAKNITTFISPEHLTKKMRASIWLLSPLLARIGEAKIGLPGGCSIGIQKLGTRSIDLHLKVLESMGIKISSKGGYIHAKGKLKGTNFTFERISVGATITAITAAVLAEGATNLYNCAQEPEIVDLCEFLLKMGAKIIRMSHSHIKIIGVQKLHGTEHKVIPDRIEAGTYMIGAAITNGTLNIRGIDIKLLGGLPNALKSAGVNLEVNGDFITVKGNKKINPVDISTAPFPNFVTDFQAQFMSLMCISNGKSIICENIYDNRFMHIPELRKMGAKINVYKNKAFVYGVKQLTGTIVKATDLRASVCLLLAGLISKGTTIIQDAFHIKRGYENIENKLLQCNIKIGTDNLDECKTA